MVITRLPFRFAEGKMHSEDYLLWLQILLNGYRGFHSKTILAFSHKDNFGQAGLSANLWAHQKGELLTYKTIYMQKLISTPFLIVLYLFSLIKFSKRIIVFFISKFSCHWIIRMESFLWFLLIHTVKITILIAYLPSQKMILWEEHYHYWDWRIVYLSIKLSYIQQIIY